MNHPKALFAGIKNWHLNNPARKFKKLKVLRGFWSALKAAQTCAKQDISWFCGKPSGILKGFYGV
jgi:hypothetical protein